MSIALTREQTAAVENRGGALLVSAAAGAGKTRVLVERLLRRVTEEGADIDRFLVITYTRAAASELRERIASELARRVAADPKNRHLRRQQTLVYKAEISTIHAFCTRLLRECAHLLELDGDFRLCDESEGKVLLLQAVEEVLESRYEGLTEESAFARLVDTLGAGRDDSRLVKIVMDVRARIQSHPDPAGWMARQEEAMALEGIRDVGETAWGQVLLADGVAQAAFWRGKLAALLELCGRDRGLEVNYAPSLSGTLEGIDRFLARAGTWEGARSALPIPFPEAGRKRLEEEDGEARRQVKETRKRCKARLDTMAVAFEEDSATLLGETREGRETVGTLFSLVRDVEAAFGRKKAKRRELDFSDLEHLAVKLLLDEEGRPTELAEQWAQRYEEIMVDEYQDTNEVQNAIFSALSQGGKNLFLVGDVKQSIYRFRLADPTIFLEKYRSFRPWEEAKEGEPRRVLLSQNFRSRQEVLGGVNDVFKSIMSTSLGEMEYSDREALRCGNPSDGAGEEYATELTVLDLEETAGDEGEGKTDKDLLEARFVAKRLEELVEGGFPVSDGEGGVRPMEYRDAAVLLRSPRGVLGQYVRALEERGIPWTAEGSRDFFGATEIQVALSLLEIVDNPRQDVALLSALRSPVYGFSADRLAQLRSKSPEGDFYAALEAGAERGEEDCRTFLEQLAQLRFEAVDRDSRQLLWHIYEKTDLLALFAAMEGGEERQGNLTALAELAGQFEAAGHKGLFGFLSQIRSLRSGGESVTGTAALGSGGVRLLSIHRSKGLEFPVVVLSGLTRRFNKVDLREPILFHPKLGVGPTFLDEERMISYPTLTRRAVARQLEGELLSEEMRLLYVGMTRAREKLLLCCGLTGGKKELKKLCADAGNPVEPQVLRESASVGHWALLSALLRPEAAPLREWAQAEREAEGGFESVWDLRLVPGEEFAQPPRRRRREAVPQGQEGEDPARLAERLSWRYPWEEDTHIPSKLTATQLKGRELDEEAAQDAPRARRAAPLRRPRFASEELGLTPTERGTALHLVMQYIDFARTGSREEIEGELERLVREEFVTPQQAQAAAPERLAAFFSSPLGREMLASGKLRRECKFSILVPAGDYYPGAGEGEQVLLQGVVDCWFETPEGITVVDFKTDRVDEESLPKRAAAYRPQLEVYARALSQVMGKPVTRRCLWFFALDRLVEG